MYIKYEWQKKYNSKSTDFLEMSLERILYYELEARFTIESDDNQKFSEDSVPIYSIVKAFKDDKLGDLEINLDGWGCNPFLVIKQHGSKIRVKNSFIDFECEKDDYVLELEKFISCVEKDINKMGFMPEWP
ncbi:hypothetical protein [Ruminiclostridium cellobioparum]|uniref:hypothetical protein n=1 Tax=Ruminiclostridium cellobioparum TaxID=29355 RepID=UPI00047F2D60|nr:hypothetical protein [Ruminiclostridium cellobioparum]